MVLISEHLPSAIVTQLKRYGYETVPLPSDPRLAPPVASHPDMLVFITEDTLISDRTYYHEIAQLQLDHICQHGRLTLLLADEPPRSDYPYDIRFNAARIGRYLFCHPAYTSPTVLAYANERKWTVVPVRQGYAGCSVCQVGDHALITADPSILRAAYQQKDLDVLSVHQGHIALPGYPHGFIGGCCGNDQNHLFFCGSLSHHPDGETIRYFARSHGHTVIELSDAPLFDCGSLMFAPKFTEKKTS